MKLYRKLFLSGTWNIAYRERCKSEILFDYEHSFIPLPKIKGYWFADPMVFKDNKDTYLFCESFDEKAQVGRLAVFRFDDGKWIDFKIILSEAYHLSYPCVFKFQDQYYMIPESEEYEAIQLYRATKFPYRWDKVGDLMNNIKIADPTVIVNEEIIRLIGYSKEYNEYILKIFEVDIEKCKMKQISQIKSDEDILRPAGYFFEKDSKLYRPAQDCRQIYGKGLILYKVENLDLYKEMFELKVDNSRIKIEGNKNAVDRLHTYTQTDDMEIIDYSVFRFDLLKRIKIFRRNCYKIRRKKEKNDYRIYNDRI